ncbi:VOC family protein [Streptomyces sp. H27-C3]|uniref:VOC family protein n=1 Tax=Streptomyces sp. H27-C3 TaxID=3046305 RepID=UPI0024BBCD6D|nr:VOC family protein [Streptomyces sp. H27-C3]MDJ0462522.1 VOC family protein [Streptomyces sp. H27-C3]
MAVPRLTLFAIVAEDMSKSLAFYRRLGLDIPADADSAPHVETVLPGGIKLAWDSVETVRSYEPDWTAPTGSHRFAVAFEYPDPQAVDAAYAELVDAGYVGHIKPWDAVWGQRYAIVLDPDGTAVDLYAVLPS